MSRDFTYIDDLVNGVSLLIDLIPGSSINGEDFSDAGDKSKVAPWRVVNIGNSKTEKLIDLINELEKTLGKKALKILCLCKQEMFHLLGQTQLC